ncbi:MAG TPA: NAD(P)/FAD-dependent oxidoreductase [Acetobacteraceae bacterium]|nr:NAD(P)/FAD-dependent oxidoreductase [Acetobacteraceae bacterium]
MIGRRTLLGAALAAPFVAKAQTGPRVVVVGGGFGGATCARWLRQARPELDVTLVEANPDYLACPFSNEVVAGMRELEAQRFTYEHLGEALRLARGTAAGVDAGARRVALEDGSSLPYDRLVLAPGIDLRFDALPGYTEAAVERMPHAWKAGPQTLLLRDQLRAMPDGGTVVMTVPANPYRCPPGPYERASLIAYYLKTQKPRSKLIVLDAKDAFSKQKLFQQAWAQLYPDNLQWVSLSDGGKVTSVDPAAMTLQTDFETYTAAVANVIPPQRAGRIAQAAGVADRTGWCPVDPVTFESRLVPGIHVIGDAAIMGAMPKSAFSANAQAKVCAAAVLALLDGQSPEEPRLINTCYSIVAPEYGISIAGVYKPVGGQLTDIEGAGGTSPLEAPAEFRAQEAQYADVWFQTITRQVFG